MIIVIRNREVVHAYAFDCSIFFCLVLFFFKNVISGCLFLISRILICFFHICIHVCNLFVHINDFFICLAICSRILLSSCIYVIYNLHLVVYVDNLVGFAFFRRPGLKPAIFQLYFLDSACCRFNFSDTLHAWDSFRDQELFLGREIVVELPLIAALPPTSQVVSQNSSIYFRTYFQVEHLWQRLSPAAINSLGMS